ncbi:MAG TPA: hypothetical protein VD864_12655 [Nocardioides sp.]|nr:hypothetical protein [Nocardioides sp.]
MRVIAVPAPRRPSSAVEPVAATASRERRREPIVVHVPVPLRPSGAVSAVEEAYGLSGDRRVVDLYL